MVWEGGLLGRDDCIPTYRGGKGSPERDRNQQGHRALEQWGLGSDQRPFAFVLLQGSRLSGEQGGIVLLAGMNGWIVGMCLTQTRPPGHRKPPQTELYSGG